MRARVKKCLSCGTFLGKSTKSCRKCNSKELESGVFEDKPKKSNYNDYNFNEIKTDRKRCVKCKTYLDMSATKCNKCNCTELEEGFHRIEKISIKQCPVCFVTHSQNVRECGFCGIEI